MSSLLATADSGSWTSILAAIVSIFGTAFVGLIAYIFHETRKDLQTDVANLRETLSDRLMEINKQIERNSKHLDSVMATIWPLIWRMNTIEDFLEEKLHYKAPRILGEAEARFRRGGEEKD